jgi:hypothetical protein
MPPHKIKHIFLSPFSVDIDTALQQAAEKQVLSAAPGIFPDHALGETEKSPIYRAIRSTPSRFEFLSTC